MKLRMSILDVFGISLVLLLLLGHQRIPAQDVKLENGRWFDGQKFVNRTVWVHDGKLKFKSNGRRTEKIIDISGKYVIPPFGEAHNHNLESEHELQKRIDNYFSNGVFYVKHQSSIKKRIEPLMSSYNHPLGLDVSLAHAPVTGTDGHPIEVRKRFLDQGIFDGLFRDLKEIETHGYFIIDSKKDLSEKWASILSFKPDFIKVVLSYSEEYDKRRDDPAYFGRKGINPKLLPLLVNEAHKSGLRVSVHVNTPTDFRHAVMAGADEIAHLPGYSNGLKITPKDARMAARKGVFVVTTAALAKKKMKEPNYADIIDGVKYNLRVLRDAGVKLAVGSDEYNDTSLAEVKFLAETGVFSNFELLKMWTENSASTIFPNRLIGKLKDGYEASFLVLGGNPIASLENFQKIEMRFKQGQGKVLTTGVLY